VKCNVQKTVLMIFQLKRRHRLVANAFPLLKIGQNIVHFVSEFRYFDHVINNDVTDDSDTKREIRKTCELCIGVTL